VWESRVLMASTAVSTPLALQTSRTTCATMRGRLLDAFFLVPSQKKTRAVSYERKTAVHAINVWLSHTHYHNAPQNIKFPNDSMLGAFHFHGIVQDQILLMCRRAEPVAPKLKVCPHMSLELKMQSMPSVVW
jgi:hypothetical protein